LKDIHIKEDYRIISLESSLLPHVSSGLICPYFNKKNKGFFSVELITTLHHFSPFFKHLVVSIKKNLMKTIGFTSLNLFNAP